MLLNTLLLVLSCSPSDLCMYVRRCTWSGPLAGLSTSRVAGIFRSVFRHHLSWTILKAKLGLLEPPNQYFNKL